MNRTPPPTYGQTVVIGLRSAGEQFSGTLVPNPKPDDTSVLSLLYDGNLTVISADAVAWLTYRPDTYRDRANRLWLLRPADGRWTCEALPATAPLTLEEVVGLYG